MRSESRIRCYTVNGLVCFDLIDVFQQARRDVREVSAHSHVLRIVHQIAELHHLGIGGTQAKLPVDLQQKSTLDTSAYSHTPKVAKSRHLQFLMTFQIQILKYV